jgi:hypothetical protein
MADPAKWTFPPRSEVKGSKEPKKLLSAIMASATPARDLLKQEEDFGLNINNNNNKSDVAAPRRLTFEGDVIPLTKEVRDKLAELSLNNNNAEKSPFLKIKKPDTKFDGTENAFSDWCYRWTFFFHFSDPPLDEPTKVALAVTALTGHAFNWWRRQFELDPDIAKSWNDLIAAMRAEFVAKDHDYRAITKLEKLTQTGSVEHYNRAFMEIYFTIGKLDSDHAKHLYMKGLTDFLRNYVRSESAILPLNALMDFTSDIAEKFSVLAITPVKKYDGGSVGQTSTKKLVKRNLILMWFVIIAGNRGIFVLSVGRGCVRSLHWMEMSDRFRMQHRGYLLIPLIILRRRINRILIIITIITIIIIIIIIIRNIMRILLHPPHLRVPLRRDRLLIFLHRLELLLS